MQDPEECPAIDILWYYDALRNGSYIFHLAAFPAG